MEFLNVLAEFLMQTDFLLEAITLQHLHLCMLFVDLLPFQRIPGSGARDVQLFTNLLVVNCSFCLKKINIYPV